MGRHSRKAPAPAPAAPAPEPAPYEPELYAPEPYAPEPYGQSYEQQYGQQYEQQYERQYGQELYAPQPYEPQPYGAGSPGGRGPGTGEATVIHQGHVRGHAPGARPGGHPEQREPGGGWGGAPGRPGAVYGDRRGAPRAFTQAPPAAAPQRDTGTPAFGTPAVGFPQVTPEAAADPLTTTGSHRRIPGPRTSEEGAAERLGNGRGTRVRTYTGMAAAAVTTVLAVVVAGQVATDNESGTPGAHAAGDDSPKRSLNNQSAASRSDGRPTPASPPPAAAPAPAQELTYEEQMARQLPIDAKLTGPNVFDTVPGVAKAPGKGKPVRYRVDVEQGLGLDPQLFADAVQRTLNDPRSWAHGGAMTFERVPAGEADFVITLASPGTTGLWCAKSGLDTTVDNVSCDSASTERVMINAFRWAQGSPTYGPDQMLAYRQMLINHEVGHRLGHGHVSCRTPGALAPIMQQQTKSLDIDNIQCKPNPWVFPGS
ncbi:DUF3152 domain-containing protein [Streptomyces sp. NBC_00249]|uniref:DUF3152 domain-containing protein n=1 Tax=Streptomyces sp. NBC_00249 TaxID=2975690 RepID=UPI0022550D39|nr:DUF3152 domain-containing protein [Streptomyces sp. NBC_00249]MCX5194542.1 DUF3152 domain-containing protein [Streptomyces sp. NBC_00249]